MFAFPLETRMNIELCEYFTIDVEIQVIFISDHRYCRMNDVCDI